MRRLFILLLFVIVTSWGVSCGFGSKPSRIEFSGTVRAGERFDRPFDDRFHFILEPQEHGWNIVIRESGRDEHLQRLTPPLHFVPNPTWIEGWHFRNSDNSGPNDGTVNAPQYEREFIFSPEVGRSIQGPDARFSPTAEDIQRVRSFGHGVLQIRQMELLTVNPGKKATIRSMSFDCVITLKR